jgi:hypothetical protein
MSDFQAQKQLMLHAAEQSSAYLREKFEAWHKDMTTDPNLDPELKDLAETLRKPEVKAAYQHNVECLIDSLKKRLSETENEEEMREALRLYVHDILLSDIFEGAFFGTVDFGYVYFEQFIKEYSEAALEAGKIATNAGDAGNVVSIRAARKSDQGDVPNLGLKYREDIVQHLGLLKWYFEQGIESKGALLALMPAIYFGAEGSPYEYACEQIKGSESIKKQYPDLKEGDDLFHQMAVHNAELIASGVMKTLFPDVPEPLSPHMYLLIWKAYLISEHIVSTNNPDLSDDTLEFSKEVIETVKPFLKRLVKDCPDMTTNPEAFKRANATLDRQLEMQKRARA